MNTVSSRRNLTIEKIVMRAGAIVRQEGAEALSMRRLADECGVTPMALYHHVKDKDEVLERVLDQVVGEMLDVRLSGRPPEKLLDFCEAIYSIMVSNPGVGRLWTSRGVTVPNMALVTERYLRLLQECGLNGARATAALDSLVLYVVGAIAYTLSRPPGVRYRLLDAVDPGSAPLLEELIDSYANRDPDAQFRSGLEALWRGLVG